MTTSMGQSVRLPDAFNRPQMGMITAVMAPPGVGDLRLDGASWRYTPPDGFQGRVVVPYARSEMLQTAVGELVITVEDVGSSPSAVKGEDGTGGGP